MVYLDNAATSGYKPKQVIDAVNNALKNYSVNPGRSGYSLSIASAEKVYETRKKAAEFFGFDAPERVVFTKNCTESANLVLKGVLEKGDHVLISNLEHNAVARPIYEMYREKQIEFDVFDAFGDVVMNIKEKVKNNTKLIFCTHASNAFGKILDIERIGQFAKENGILFAVDAAQTAGVLPINMNSMNIDFLCVAPHKGLYSPVGIGLLLCKADVNKTIIQGGTGTNSLELLQPEQMPEKLESGTLNLCGIFGVSAGIDFVKQKGLKQIANYENNLINHLKNGLHNIKDVIVYDGDWDSVPLVSFNIKGVATEDVSKYLDKHGIAVRAGYHCAPLAHTALNTKDTGSVRVSVGLFNSKKDICYFLNVIKTFVSNYNLKSKKISYF